MQVKDKLFGSWVLYLSFGTSYEVIILQLCSFNIHEEYVDITERSRTMYEKCLIPEHGLYLSFDTGCVLI